MLLLGGLGARAQTNSSSPRELRLLSRVSLPTAHSPATDIRWASDDSVYVAWESDGVAEVSLAGAKRRVLIPDLKTLGGIDHYSHLAVSADALVVGSQLHSFVWRPLKADAGGHFEVHHQPFRETQDLDLAGDRILLLGHEKHEETYSPKGEIAWVGSLSGKLADLAPVLHDAGGAGAPHYRNCGSYRVGAVRFLGNGTYVVAPGFQDGVQLLDASGRPVQSWTSAQVGLDSHVGCATMSAEEEKKYRVDDNYLLHWIKSHHILDDILPLPQGPGLLVRSWGTDGEAHWALKILQSDGIKTYALPITGSRPFDRLHGDVRNGRIVLLLSNSGYPWSKAPEDLPAEIMTMALPD
jgi:hypothetical protein